MFPSQTKHYSRDLFGLLYGILVFVSFCTSLEKNLPQNSGYLNRDLTEEWKGWMQVRSWHILGSPKIQERRTNIVGTCVQVLFLMYHYFNAAEMYNSIRLYIAVSTRPNLGSCGSGSLKDILNVKYTHEAE